MRAKIKGFVVVGERERGGGRFDSLLFPGKMALKKPLKRGPQVRGLRLGALLNIGSRELSSTP